MKVTVFIILISFSVAEAQSLRDLPGTALNGELRFNAVDFLKGYGVREETLVWQQVISKYFPGLGGSVAFKTRDQYSFGVLGNAPTVDMFRIILGNDSNRYRNMNRVPFGLVQLRVKDLSKYMLKVDGEFQYSNVSTFQLITTRPTGPSRIRKLLIDEIDEYYGLQMSWQRQRKKCLVLGLIDSTLVTYKSGPETLYLDVDSANFNDVTVKEIVRIFVESIESYYYSPYPVVDETHFKGRVGGIHFTCDFNNYRELDEALHKYGMYLRLEERPVDVLVLKEKGYDGPPQPLVRELNTIIK